MPPELIPLGAALGRTTAEDVTASADVPPTDNSAVDGYAVCGDDVPAEGHRELSVAGLHADVVALAIARIVVVLRDIQTACEHVHRERDVSRRETEVGRGDAVHVELRLRQVEVEIEIQAAEARHAVEAPVQLFAEPRDLVEFRARNRELQRFSALPAYR